MDDQNCFHILNLGMGTPQEHEGLSSKEKDLEVLPILLPDDHFDNERVVSAPIETPIVVREEEETRVLEEPKPEVDDDINENPTTNARENTIIGPEHFSIIQQLGTGSCGKVYLVQSHVRKILNRGATELFHFNQTT